MRKVLTIALIMLFVQSIFSQKMLKKKDLRIGWTTKGNVSLLLNQAAFSNWTAGGESSYSGTLGIDYGLYYKTNSFLWSNLLIASFGLTKTDGSDFIKKTDDRLLFNSIVGYEAEKNWYYSFFTTFRTQFAKGYKYEKNSSGEEIRTEFTNFFSPAYLSLGPGMLWEKNTRLKFNIAPISSKITFVNKNFTLPDGAYFGVDEGKSYLLELGFNFQVFYEFNIMKNIKMKNYLVLYSNYLDNPKNVDLDYTMKLDMKINNYFEANLTFQAIYDDNAYQGFQTREILGIGVKFGF